MRVNGTLAVSRAIGDLDYKIYGVLALPEVYDEIAQDDVEFIVLACDGLWDVVSNQEVVEVVRSCVQGTATADLPCVKACLLYLEGKHEEGDALLKEELKLKCTEEPTYEEVELEGSKVTKPDLPSRIAQTLIRLAYIRNSTDNISVIVALKPVEGRIKGDEQTI